MDDVGFRQNGYGNKLNVVKEWSFKLILLGDSSVGKTSLLRRYANDETPMELHKPTIGVDFRAKQMVVEEEHCRALIWDTAGQERFKSMTKQYYKGAQGVILVYDVTNRNAFDHVERWLNDFKKFVDTKVDKILVGNKCDVDESEREVSKEEGVLLGISLDVPFMETSARDNINVQEAFSKIITDLVLAKKRRNSYLPATLESTNCLNAINGSSTLCSKSIDERIVLNTKHLDKEKIFKKRYTCCT